MKNVHTEFHKNPSISLKVIRVRVEGMDRRTHTYTYTHEYRYSMRKI
jgi:hypothetical protein